MKLASRTADFYGHTNSQTEALRHLRAAGFRYVDYSFGADHSGRTGIYSEGAAAHLDAVAQTAEELGIQLIQAHSPMGKPLDDPDGQFMADTQLCVEACGRWGIGNLVVHSGYLPNLSKEDTFARNKEFFLPLLETAEKYGVNILVENFNKMYKPDVYWIDNATDLLTMIETVDHPLFHAVWDTGHANLQPMPQDEEMRLLGSHLRALHIHDNMGDKDTHMLPFQGTMDMDSVLCGLRDIDYKGYFTFEVGRFFAPTAKRRTDCPDGLLTKAPIELQDAMEGYLYTLGKTVLETYGLYEE